MIKPVTTRDSGGTLINGLISSYDISSEGSVRKYIEQTLRGVGVSIVIAEQGSYFDPKSQQCVERAAAPTPAQSRHVARTVRPGWIDHEGKYLREPEVTVWMSS